MEGLNDGMSMQSMVQQLVDRALMLEGKQHQIDNRKRKYGQGKYNSGAQQRPRFTPNSGGPFQHNGGHNHIGEVRTTIVAPRMVMGMEEATDRTAPTHQHQPRGI